MADPAFTHPRRWAAFLLLLVGGLMDLVDGTIVNVALPTIQRDLAAGGTELEWIVSGYLVVFAVTLITAGRLGDRHGHKRLFLAGVLLFSAASLACGLSPSPGSLIVARLVQGFAAGIMVPQVLASARNLFAGAERATVFAIYGAVAGLAVAGGLLLGGVLTDADLFGLGWRSVFLVNVPVALIVLVPGALVIPETRDPATPGPDLVGTGLLTAGLLAIVYVVLEGRGLGWPAWIWLLAALGLGALAALAWVEGSRRRDSEALLPTALFRIPAFSAGNIIQFLFSAAMAGFFFVLTIWLQAGEGFSALAAGLTALVFSAGTVVFAGMPQRLIPRFGRWVLVVGGGLMAAGASLTAFVAAAGGPLTDGWPLAPGLFVAGVGLALLIIPLANVVMSAVPVASAGGASGVLSTAQQLGGAIGIGVVGEVFFAAAPASGLRDAFLMAVPLCAVGFGVCALLSTVLPDTAVAETYG